MTRVMKDSGAIWIGKYPSNWQLIRLKYLVDIETGNSDTQDAEPEGIYPFYVRSPNIERSNSYTFYGDAILMAGDGVGAGKVFHYATGKYAVHQRVYCLHRFKPIIEPKFLLLFLSNRFPARVEEGTAKSTVDSIRLPMLRDFPVLIPPAVEMRKIVSFLEQKCTEIDSLSDDIQSEIEVLEEYRNSIITISTTRGISSAKLKESNIKWCPMIPENWNRVPAKNLFKLNKQRSLPGDKQLTSSQKYGILFQDDYTRLENQQVVLVDKDFSILKHVNPGDFVISMRSFQGGLEYSELSGCISSAYVMLTPDSDKVYAPFYRWFFKSRKYINALQSTTNLVRDGQALRYSNFAMIDLFEVPISEQKEIANYLDFKCSEIDSILSTKKQQLEKLASYKKSLIYEYVTGKKEVL